MKKILILITIFIFLLTTSALGTLQNDSITGLQTVTYNLDSHYSNYTDVYVYFDDNTINASVWVNINKATMTGNLENTVLGYTVTLSNSSGNVSLDITGTNFLNGSAEFTVQYWYGITLVNQTNFFIDFTISAFKRDGLLVYYAFYEGLNGSNVYSKINSSNYYQPAVTPYAVFNASNLELTYFNEVPYLSFDKTTSSTIFNSTYVPLSTNNRNYTSILIFYYNGTEVDTSFGSGAGYLTTNKPPISTTYYTSKNMLYLRDGGSVLDLFYYTYPSSFYGGTTHYNNLNKTDNGVVMIVERAILQQLGSYTNTRSNLSLYKPNNYSKQAIGHTGYFYMDGQYIGLFNGYGDYATSVNRSGYYLHSFMIYDNLLTDEELLSIYNDGNVLNYDEAPLTTDGLVCNTDNSLCYDADGVCLPFNDYYDVPSDDYLCSSPLIIGNDLYCDISNVSFCAGGCTNVLSTNPYGVTYTYGSCVVDAVDCVNDCSIEGLTYSDSSTSYKRCGFTDADVCLDWSMSIPCEDGQFSQDGFCVNLNSSYSTYYNNKAFTVIPNTDFASSYDLNSLPPFVNLNSKYSFLEEGFNYQSSDSSYLINLNCDYSETEILNNQVVSNYNSTNTFNGYTNGVTTINFYDSNNDSITNITGIDVTGTTVYKFGVEKNSTYGICVYDLISGSNLIGCETIPNNALKSVDFKIQTTRKGTNYAVSTATIINGDPDGKQDIYTNFKTTPSSNTYVRVNVSSNSNISINSVRVVNGESYNNPWINYSALTYTPSSCSNGDVIDISDPTDEQLQNYLSLINATSVKAGLPSSVTFTEIISYYSDIYDYYNDNCLPIPVYDLSCYYSETGCKTVRSYYATNSTLNGFWNYKDVKICVDSLTNPTVDISTEKNAFSNISAKTKLLIALLFTAILFGLTIALGYSLGSPKTFGFIGVFFVVGSIGYFAISGWLPSWLVVIMFVIASGITMMFFRTVFNDSGSA